MTDSIQSLPHDTEQRGKIINPENRQPPEIIYITDGYTHCDGGGEINPAQGHPRVYLTIPKAADFIDCPYCDRRFQQKIAV